jgi:Ner family transcriptional regulator
MRRASIIAAIKNAGFTLKRLSEIHGLSPAACSVCLSKPWPQVEKIIATVIGIPPHKIWPPRYSPKGMPIKRGARVKSSRRKEGATKLNNRPGSKNRRRSA